MVSITITQGSIVDLLLQITGNGTAPDAQQRRRRHLLQAGASSSSAATQADGVTVYYDIGNVDSGRVDETATALEQTKAVTAFRKLLVERGTLRLSPSYSRR